MARVSPDRDDPALTTLFAFAVVFVGLAVIWLGGA